MRAPFHVALWTAAVVLTLGAAGIAHASPQNDLSIRVDHTGISTKLGRKFTFRSTITNTGSKVADGLIAHLNVLSLRSSVYVDPEDWSSRRTRYLAPIPAGGSTTITWRLEAVNAGRFGVYVAVVPQSGAAVAPATGSTIRVEVLQRRTLNSGGILPLALGLPTVIGLLAVGFRLTRRQGVRPLRLRLR
jgi:hypothetical protein